MPKETFQIPQRLAEINSFQQNAVDLANTNKVKWVIDPLKLTDIAVLRADYETKYNVASNKNIQSPAITKARDAAWELYKPALEDLYNKDLLYNPQISPEDKVALNIHIATGGGVAVILPGSFPMVSFTSEGYCTLGVGIADSTNSNSHAKPHGVGFTEIWGKVDVATAPPVNISECTRRFNVSANNDLIKFDPADRGKTFFGYCRWVGPTGELGVISPMVSTMIP